MTTDEFYNEFNLAYNNLASNQAPGLDKYEISVYLTKAQNALIDALYGEFEKSEEARRKLAPVVVTAKLKPSTIEYDTLYSEYTTIYSTEEIKNLRYIINEQVKMSSKANNCIKGKHLKVQPVLHDELDSIVENPFRFNLKRALRLDTSNETKPFIEILTKDNHIEYYQIRYVATPYPIILDDLSNYGTSIEGKTDPLSINNPATLPDFTHRQIIEIAAKLAYSDYKQ